MVSQNSEIDFRPKKQLILNQVRDHLQETVVFFEQPFASEDYTTEGEIQEFYTRMEMMYRNLIHLGALSSFGI